MAGRDVFFYAGSVDLDEIMSYYEARGENEGRPSPRIATFMAALRERLVEAGLPEGDVFEPAAGLQDENAEGSGLYVIFEMNDASTAAQKIAFDLAREMGIGTFDTIEGSDGVDSTEYYYSQLKEEGGRQS